MTLWWVCVLPVGVPTLGGMLASAKGSAKRGLGVGLRVGMCSAPLTLAAEFVIFVWSERRIDNATLLGLMVAAPATLFAVLAAYLVWRERRST